MPARPAPIVELTVAPEPHPPDIDNRWASARNKAGWHFASLAYCAMDCVIERPRWNCTEFIDITHL